MSFRRAAARRWWVVAACVGTLWLAPSARAQQDSVAVPAALAFVSDSAGVIGPERSAQLEAFLDQLQRKTGVQFAVLTVPTTGAEAPEQYKVRVFKAWGLGRKGVDDGLLLLVAMKERRAVFETGYGIEGTLPDGWLARMSRDLLMPRFQRGEYADGITAAVLASARRIADEKGVTVEWTGAALNYDTPRARRSGPPEWWIALLVVIVILNVVNASRGGRRGSRYGPWIGGGPWMGGGGWGGGFGGGGGGGGSSFGGFGGGSSGGGGGGTSW